MDGQTFSPESEAEHIAVNVATPAKNESAAVQQEVTTELNSQPPHQPDFSPSPASPTPAEPAKPLFPPDQPPAVAKPKRSKIPYLFALLALILIAGAVFGGYKWEHARALKAENVLRAQIISLTNNNDSLQKQTASLEAEIKQSQGTNSTSTSSTATQYLGIKQLGIKIPLTDTTADMGFTWDAKGGYNNYPIAIIGSKTLMQDAEKDDPSQCTTSIAAKSNNLYPIGYIYSTYWKLGGSGSTEVKSVKVDGKSYYWYSINAGGVCDLKPGSLFSADLNSYYESALNSFSHSVQN